MSVLQKIHDFFLPPKEEKLSGIININLETGKETPVEHTDGGKLFATIMSGACPDCLAVGKGFYKGPSGGMSTNIQCVECEAWFNVTSFGAFGGGGIAERIPGKK